MVLLREQVFGEGRPEDDKMGHWGRSYPQHLDNSNTFLGLNRDDRQALAVLDNGKQTATSGVIMLISSLSLSLSVQNGGEMSELDDAGTYFDLGPRKVTSTAVYRYLSTRNNNFTNRSQKGKVIVAENSMTSARIGLNGGMAQINK